MKYLLIILIALPLTCFSQVTGIVLDAENDLPLIGASIRSGGHSTITNSSGQFTINPTKSDSITISYLGYVKTRVVINTSNDLSVKLHPDPMLLNEVVVTVPVFAKRLKSVAGGVSVLSAGDLQSGQSVSIATYLNQIPGIYLHSGTYSTNRLTIRGIGSRTPYNTNRIKAYFDEIPLTTGEGVTTIEDIDLAGIGRIEVFKGPSSALYGAGLGGVLKIQPVFSGSNGIKAGFNTETGSFGLFRNTLTGSYRSNKSSILASASTTKVNGYRENSTYARNSFFIAGKHYGASYSISTLVNLIDVSGKIPSSLDEQTFTNSPKSAAGNWLNVKGFEEYNKLLMGVSISNQFSTVLSNKLSLFSSYINQYESRPFNILDDDMLSVGLRDKFLISLNSVNFVLGVEMFSENYNWKIFETNNGSQSQLLNKNKERRNYINGFGIFHYKIAEKLNVSAGLNFNSLTYKLFDKYAEDSIDNTGKYAYNALISPRIGINYAVNSSIHFFASAGHGFSAPSLEETLLPKGNINSGLKPEEGWMTEIGSRGNSKNKKLRFELGYYWIFLNNLLVTKRLTEDTFYGDNAGKTNHNGLEAFLMYKVFTENTQSKSLTFSANYTHSTNVFKHFIDDESNFTNNKLPGIPSYNLNLSVHSKIPLGIDTWLTYQKTGKQYLDDANTKSYQGYDLMNFKIAYTKTIAKKISVQFYSGIQNLFNNQYASMILVNAPTFGNNAPRYYYPGLARNYYIGLKMSIL